MGGGTAGAVVCWMGAARVTGGCSATSASGNLADSGFCVLLLALGRAGTLKSCCDNKAARLVGAVGKGI
jgi:hypothetical protein